MSCPYLKKTNLASRDGTEIRYSCRMGKTMMDLPAACSVCSMNPESCFKTEVDADDTCH